MSDNSTVFRFGEFAPTDFAVCPSAQFEWLEFRLTSAGTVVELLGTFTEHYDANVCLMNHPEFEGVVYVIDPRHGDLVKLHLTLEGWNRE